MTTKKWMTTALLCLVAGCQLFGSPRWAPPAEGSRIVVYRPGDLTGFAKHFMLTLDGNRQAAIANGEYHVMNVLPGRHRIALEDTDAQLSVPAQALQAHYFRLKVVKDKDSLSARLDPVTPEVAEETLPDLREADPYVQPESEGEFHIPGEESKGPRT